MDYKDMELRDFRTPNGICKCGIVLHESTVVVSQLPDYNGPTVTNAIEYIAQQVCLSDGISLRDLIVIEHWPIATQLKETFDLVTFGFNDDNTRWIPAWQSISREEAERLLGTAIPR